MFRWLRPFRPVLESMQAPAPNQSSLSRLCFRKTWWVCTLGSGVLSHSSPTAQSLISTNIWLRFIWRYISWVRLWITFKSPGVSDLTNRWGHAESGRVVPTRVIVWRQRNLQMDALPPPGRRNLVLMAPIRGVTTIIRWHVFMVERALQIGKSR